MTNVTRLASLKRFADIPGPKGLPLIGTAHKYIVGNDGMSFKKLFEVYSKRAEKYGPIFKEKIGPVTSVVVSDPAEYKKIVQKDGKLPKRMELWPIHQYRLLKGMSQGLDSSSGPEWLRLRTAVNKNLLRPEEVKTFAPAMHAVADDLVHYIGKGLDEHGRYKESLEDPLFRWGLESVGTALVGTRIGTMDKSSESGNQFLNSVRGMFRGLQDYNVGIPVYKFITTPGWSAFMGHCDHIYRTGASILAEEKEARLVGGKDKSTRSLLYDLTSKRGDLSQPEVEGLVIDILSGGVETVASLLLWCLYSISKSSSDLQEKLYEEVSRIRPDDVISLDSSFIPYVKACIKETLRLYSIAALTSRIIQEEVEVCGYLLPAGTHVQGNVYYMNRSPKLFERPTEFEPDRWIREYSADAGFVSQLVWGHGARMCLGRRLAEQEAYIALSKIIKKYTIVYDGEYMPKPVMNPIIQPDIPIKIRFIERS